MAKQFFVMGIGGTGMRCIESLIHLCAMGMFDNTEIHLLALDTDKNNGNFSRLKEVKEAYVNSKNLDKANRTPLTDTFFSADIKYYEFSPNYEKKSTFNDVFNYGNTKYRLTRQCPWHALTKYQRNTIEEERNIPYPTQLASESLKLGVERFGRSIG